MDLAITIVDAFTDKRFAGNPAAVIIMQEWLSCSVMQSIASENNLSETAFIVFNPNGCYDIRWFSPLTEVAFCGHATLAAASVLFAQPVNSAESLLTFHAKAVGDIPVQKLDNGALQMSFPSRQPERISDAPDVLLQGLSIAPQEVWRNQQAYFAVYTDSQQVLDVKPELDRLKQLAPWDVVVTAPANDDDVIDFVSRYFWPANGGDEDPVTGSIHAGLAPFWAERLSKRQLNAHQVSARGGYLSCLIDDDRVLVAGHTVNYLSGTIVV